MNLAELMSRLFGARRPARMSKEAAEEATRMYNELTSKSETLESRSHAATVIARNVRIGTERRWNKMREMYDGLRGDLD